MLRMLAFLAMYFGASVEKINRVTTADKNQSTKREREHHHRAYVSQKRSLRSINTLVAIDKRLFIEFPDLFGYRESRVSTQNHLAFHGCISAARGANGILHDGCDRFPISGD